MCLNNGTCVTDLSYNLTWRHWGPLPSKFDISYMLEQWRLAGLTPPVTFSRRLHSMTQDYVLQSEQSLATRLPYHPPRRRLDWEPPLTVLQHLAKLFFKLLAFITIRPVDAYRATLVMFYAATAYYHRESAPLVEVRLDEMPGYFEPIDPLSQSRRGRSKPRQQPKSHQQYKHREEHRSPSPKPSSAHHTPSPQPASPQRPQTPQASGSPAFSSIARQLPFAWHSGSVAQYAPALAGGPSWSGVDDRATSPSTTLALTHVITMDVKKRTRELKLKRFTLARTAPVRVVATVLLALACHNHPMQTAACCVFCYHVYIEMRRHIFSGIHVQFELVESMFKTKVLVSIYPVGGNAFWPKHIWFAPGDSFALGRWVSGGQRPASNNLVFYGGSVQVNDNAPRKSWNTPRYMGIQPVQATLSYHEQELFLMDAGSAGGTYRASHEGESHLISWHGMESIRSGEHISFGCEAHIPTIKVQEWQTLALASGVICAVQITRAHQEVNALHALDNTWREAHCDATVAALKEQSYSLAMDDVPTPKAPLIRIVESISEERAQYADAPAPAPSYEATQVSAAGPDVDVLDMRPMPKPKANAVREEDDEDDEDERPAKRRRTTEPELYDDLEDFAMEEQPIAEEHPAKWKRAREEEAADADAEEMPAKRRRTESEGLVDDGKVGPHGLFVLPKLLETFKAMAEKIWPRLPPMWATTSMMHEYAKSSLPSWEKLVAFGAMDQPWFMPGPLALQERLQRAQKLVEEEAFTRRQAMEKRLVRARRGADDGKVGAGPVLPRIDYLEVPLEDRPSMSAAELRMYKLAVRPESYTVFDPVVMRDTYANQFQKMCKRAKAQRNYICEVCARDNVHLHRRYKAMPDSKFCVLHRHEQRVARGEMDDGEITHQELDVSVQLAELQPPIPAQIVSPPDPLEESDVPTLPCGRKHSKTVYARRIAFYPATCFRGWDGELKRWGEYTALKETAATRDAAVIYLHQARYLLTAELLHHNASREEETQEKCEWLMKTMRKWRSYEFVPPHLRHGLELQHDAPRAEAMWKEAMDFIKEDGASIEARYERTGSLRALEPILE